MQFLADVFVPCDQCDGKRFKPQVLEVRYKGRNIHQVLDLTVREALTFFSSSPKVLRRLQVLDANATIAGIRTPGRSASRSPPSRPIASAGPSIPTASRCSPT